MLIRGIALIVAMFLADHDECRQDSDNDCSQICNNIEGGYVCSCQEGYELLSDNRTCEGIDMTSNLDLSLRLVL